MFEIVVSNMLRGEILQLKSKRSKRLMPDTVSYITHLLMKDGVPSENSNVIDNLHKLLKIDKQNLPLKKKKNENFRPWYYY